MTPVVLLHGAAQDAGAWEDVVPLVPGVVVAHELPGHGARPGPPLTAIADVVADVARAIHAVGPPTVLVGHSMGGIVAVATARTHPDLVAGLVVVGTPIRSRADRRVGEVVAARDLARFTYLTRLGVLGLQLRPPATHLRSADRLECAVRRNGMDTVAADLAVLSAADLSGVGPAGVPMVALAGTRDGLVSPRRARELADALGVELEVVPGASHQLQWEAPAVVAEAIAKVRDAAATTARA